MQNLVSLILIIFTTLLNNVSLAQSGVPHDSSQCTRGNNSLQDVKDAIVSAQAELQQASKKIDDKQIEPAKKHTANAAASISAARTKAETNDRSLPDSWLSDFRAFTTDIQAAKKTSDALKTRVITLIKRLDDVGETMSCPRAQEPVRVGLLPPEPGSKDLAKKSANYKVYALGLNGKAQLVKEWDNKPFGDCPDCTRGISLNCRDHGKDLPGQQTKKAACAAGLDNGIGIRLVIKDKKLDADVKNGSHYTVTQQFNALEKVLPPPGDSNIVQLFILKQGVPVAPENLIYQVVMSVQ